MLLNEKIRKQLEKIINTGAPAQAAALSIGIRPRTISDWLALGLSIEILEKPPEKPDEVLEFEDETLVGITAKQWYEHKKQCKTLADTVCKVEGKKVGDLTKRLWAKSKRNPIVQQFLFKTYSHVHNIPRELPMPMQLRGENSISNDQISVILPDNFRTK